MCKWCKDNKECWVACLDLIKKDRNSENLTDEEKKKVSNYRWGNTMQTLETL